jgi:hypothetical protein
MFMFGIELFRQKAADLFWSWAVERWALGDIKQIDKRFGKIDWVGRQMVCSLHE